MKVTLTIPDGLLASVASDQNTNVVRNKVKGLRQSKAWWTMKRYLIIGTASAVAGIVSDGLNRCLTATGTDSRLMSVQSVPNNHPSTVRKVR